MLLFLTLTGKILDSEWTVYQHSTESIPAIRNVHLALLTEEKLVIERGISNSLLRQDIQDGAAALARLAPARAASAQAFATLRQSLQAQASPWLAPVAANVQLTEDTLAAMRKEVDSLAALPKVQRDPEAVTTAVDMAMTAVDAFTPTVTALSSIAIQADPQSHGGIDSAQLASSLRNIAGQMMSTLTAAIVAQRPLTIQERYTFAKLSGQAEQLCSVIELQLRGYSHKPDFKATLESIHDHSMGEGVDFLNTLYVIGRTSGDYGLTSEQVVARYVPKMTAIPHLRDMIVAEMLRQAEYRNQWARYILLATVGLAILALGIFVLLLRVIRQRVLRPILEATNLFVALAGERQIAAIPVPHYDDEISDMMRAINILKTYSQQKKCLEKEREQMIVQLRAASDTDFLTGLLNRRALFSQGEQQFGIARRYRRQLALILMDVDHFKTVNDKYGHRAGDQVLCMVAELSRRFRRKVDLLARYGGEEFLLLLPEIDLGQGNAVAEKLRTEIEACHFKLDGGAVIKVTASFGVVAFDGDDTLESLIARADLALYKAKNGGRNMIMTSPRDTGLAASDSTL
ncbi:GGDEF domain protein [Collimonas arenae]|uniref:diguanylate cyclase n=1 Tax=Collimonas arenae TaxID=279058 RepID=A0A0A1FGW3_9BURK|nr:GGDEF domain-containing protein [Collimonas arenae]AIY42844.1 GGDEF domain protein [Collimonas arenae]